jgi:light-regulated signal transduction histidine kinase (bacteriophytochrome)
MRLDRNAVAAVTGTATVASKDFEDFIYLISHDVRNSVRALIEVPQWIAEDLVDAGHRIDGPLGENIRLLNTHTSRLDRMLNDLLTYSRVGRMQQVVEMDLAAALESLLMELRLPAGFRLTLDLAAPVVRIGESDLMTLLTALVTNSIRHRDRDTGEIQIATRREGAEVVLTYRDDSPGIPKPLREKAFRAMTTLKSRDEVEGSGMGLAHVAKIVATYHAELKWLETEAERGVAFEFRFPE